MTKHGFQIDYVYEIHSTVLGHVFWILASQKWPELFFYPYLINWGWYNMFSSCCDKDSAIVLTTGHLTDVNPRNWSRYKSLQMQTNGLTCFPRHGGREVARDLLFPSFILLSGVGTTCFSYMYNYFYYLLSTLLETGVGANDCKCTRDKHAFRSTEEPKIINYGHPSDDWPLRTLLSYPVKRDKRTFHMCIVSLYTYDGLWSDGDEPTTCHVSSISHSLVILVKCGCLGGV
jgi:hypothetical protein